ncbi:MAG: hypothetical protein ACP5TE_04455 [Verrucomicrobiia bacterium]
MIKQCNSYILCFILILSTAKTFSKNPDPESLLKGVEAIRQQIPPSYIKIKFESLNPFRQNINYYEIYFDKELRYYYKSNINDMVKILYNGSEVLQYSSDTIYITSLSQSSSYPLFDPRILGISLLFWQSTIKSSLRYNKSCFINRVPYLSVELVGNDNIDGNDVWHIKVKTKDDLSSVEDVYGYWVDAKNNFRVYKYEEYLPNIHHIIIKSRYNDNIYKYLPVLVETKSIDPDGKVNWCDKIEIVEAKCPIKIESKMWTIAGLDPKKGAEVVDLRIKKGIGYWNGTKVVTLNELNQPQQPKVPRMLFIGLMLIVFFAPLIEILAKKLRKTP